MSDAPACGVPSTVTTGVRAAFLTVTGVNVSSERSITERPCAADVATWYVLDGSSEPFGIVNVVVNPPSVNDVTHPCAIHPAEGSAEPPDHTDVSPKRT